jgi:hypothetical protein
MRALGEAVAADVRVDLAPRRHSGALSVPYWHAPPS